MTDDTVRSMAAALPTLGRVSTSPATAPTTQVLVVSDTHLTGATLHRLPDAVWSLADAADVVLHAGDVVDRTLLDALGERAPTHAVLGNNDHALVGDLPEEGELVLAGVAVAMVHDAGPTAGRPARMARRFPTADVVVFGHSHQPEVTRQDDGPLLVNPGSAVQRRRQAVHSVAWLVLADGRVERAEVVPVGPLADPGAVASVLASARR